MAYEISIAGVDRTDDVINQSVVVEDIINDQVNTCSFSLINLNGTGVPATDDEVIITLPDDTILFGGYIISVMLSKREYGEVTAKITCKDYTALLDRNLVHKSYEDMTDKEIIEDIIATYCAGFGITTNNVTEGVTINQISFNYIHPSQAFRRLSDLSGRNWYIDYEKDIHYFPLATDAAPIDLDTDTRDSFQSLRIDKNASQLKNRIYVRGGTTLSDFTTYEEKGDGEKTVFVLPDKPHDITVEVNGTPQTLGIKNVDLSGFNWYVNFQEKYVEQDAGGVVLTTADTLAVTYKYDIPILVAQEDTASIAENGVYEFSIFDKTIETTTDARDRATAELTDYANDLIEGSFTTFEAGFKSGQYINIDLDDFDVDSQYVVRRVIARSFGAGNFHYEVSLASAKTMGIIRFLIELLEQNRNLIELDDNETIDELLSVSDSLLSDSLQDALTIDSAGAYFTWATASELTPLTTARWNLFQWG